MQENKERLEARDEQVQNDKEEISDVMANQTSLFDNDEVFTEAMVVEKQPVDIDSTPDSSSETKENGTGGDTAIFTFAKDKAKTEEISHDELTVADIESSAKDYYNANHADDIEDKVKELCDLANTEFSDNGGETALGGAVEEYLDEKIRKEKKKKKRKGFVSNDDMELLSSDESSVTLNRAAVEEAAARMSSEQEVDARTDEEIVFTQEATVENPVREEVEINSEPDREIELDEEEIAEAEQMAQQEENDGSVDEAEYEGEEDDGEKQLFTALGGEDTDSEEYLKKYEELYSDDTVEYEYTSKEQDGYILMNLRKSAMSCMSKMMFTLIAFIVCLYFETAAVTSIPGPAFLEAGKFGVTYSMAMLQIMFIGVILNLDGLKRAFKGLRPSKSSVESFAAIICIVCTLHSVLSAIFVGTDPSLRSFCAVGCFALFMLSVNSFIKAQTTLSAFCVVASKKTKYACRELDRNVEEAAAFENYLDEDSVIVTVGKSSFVEGFFKKIQKIPYTSKCSFKRICTALCVSAVFGVVYGFISADLYSGICGFTVVSLMSLPVSTLLMTALPFFNASSKLYETQTAFIGEAVCDAYDDTNVISFDDTEVFNPKAVKVSSIKTYGDNRIDKVIVYMARIFDEAKGPLSYVFANSVQDIDEAVGKARIEHFYSGGIKASIDERVVLVGTGEYMLENEFVPVEDNIDETFTGSMGSIMYMAIDGTLAAKFYIKYSVNTEFEKTLRAFYDAGVCVAVKTLDPCVTTELVSGFLKGSNYPFAVVNKGSEGTQMSAVSEKTDGTVVSLSGVHNFIKGFIKADKLRNIYRTNSVFTAIASVLGFVISALAVVLLDNLVAGVFFMVVLQFIWCLPLMIVSAFSK